MIDFFTDPILRAPTWGCIFMCIASSLMGVLIFLKKRSLLSESLSHAAYPGACLGVFFFAIFFPQYEEWTFLAVIGGAFISSLLGLKAIHWLENKGRVHSDAALCFVLAIFFGFGIVIASGMQRSMPVWYMQVQMLLFGQVATMNDIHVWIYGTLAAFIAFFLYLTYPTLQASLFDREFSIISRLRVTSIEKISFWLLLISIIVGIRSVGVVLMSGMLIAPAISARQFTNRLSHLFILSSFFGASSALFGNWISVYYNLPTGPSIVLIGSLIALFSLIFSPKKGLFFRMIRIVNFRLLCVEENILKEMWKKGKTAQNHSSFERFALWKLKRGGWVNSKLELTSDGFLRASSIVRLHRLWELYLTESLGFNAEKVHHTAEEMEHILTPEMEKKLTHLLENPKVDPHFQPIPEKKI